MSDSLAERPDAFGGPSGDFDTGSWFRGDAALFGGVSYALNDQTSFSLEYSTDTYDLERRFGVQPEQRSPLNFGVSHTFDNGLNVNGYYVYGTDVGFMVSYQIDPSQPETIGGRAPVAPPLLPRPAMANGSWDTTARADAAALSLATQLEPQGMSLLSAQIEGATARITVENTRWSSEVQAVGRTARILANTLHPEVSTFVISYEVNGVILSSVTLQRDDLGDLEFALEGNWQMQARAQVNDGYTGAPNVPIPGVYPDFQYGIGPYANVVLFNPDAPVRFDVGVQAFASYEPTPGLIASGMLRYPLYSTIDDATRVNDSVLPRVRSDGLEYARQSDLEINYLTLEYFYRPAQDTFGRVSFGYLESMYGGLSAEVLWAPLNSRLALGAEVNYVQQRDFDTLFGFQDYDVVTGHASAYYDIGGGYVGQLDIGRYLAGDWGGTLTLAREFDTGFRVGAFATLTDVSFEDFGEGSFDKGIFFEVPITFFTGEASRSQVQQIIRPVDRDGGARLNVNNRLFDMTYDYRNGDLSGDWGTFYQ